MKKNNPVIYNLFALALGGVVGCMLNLTGLTTLSNIFIAPLGALYLRVLQFVALPMIFCLVADSITSFPNMRAILSLSILSLSANAIIALFVGILCCSVTVFFVSRGYLSFAFTTVSTIKTFTASNYMDGLMNLVQSNISGRFMQQYILIIFVASVFLGILIAKEREKFDFLAKFASSLNAILNHVLGTVMLFAPIGVFAITLNIFASNNLAALRSLLGLISLAFVTSLISTIISIFCASYLSKKSFLSCFKAQAPAIFFGFATSASTACIPLALEVAEELSCKRETSAFVIPFTKMLMKHGGLLDTYCSLAFVVVASGQVLPLYMWAYMILISLIFSLAAPAIPMGGVFIIPTALAYMGLAAPEKIVALIFTVYIFLDMFGTGMTCSLDVLSALIVDKFESHKAQQKNLQSDC